MYNEDVVTNSIRPSLVDLFVEVARKIDDKVIGTEHSGVNCYGLEDILRSLL